MAALEKHNSLPFFKDEDDEMHTVFQQSTDAVGLFGPIAEDLDEASKTVSQANNHFGLQLHLNLCKEGGNVFFSPFSISTALAMLFRGATGHTAEEMRAALGYDFAGLDTETVHQNFRQLLAVLEEKSEHTLCIANAILCQNSFPFIDDYKNDVQNLYRAVVREVDFVKESAVVVEEINKWVTEKTHDMIKKLLDSLDPCTVMVLLNAVYFKGTWNKQFDPKNTKSLPFFNRGLDSTEATMMYVEGKFRYFQTDDFQAVELPYKGDAISMVVVLPQKRDGLKEVEAAVCSGANTIPKNLFRRFNVNVTLPKLHLEYEKGLNDILQGIGLTKMFSETSAEFGKLTASSNVFVSQVVHKAVLVVNEEGTEAAAVTGVIMMKRSLPISVDFVADHPFLFFIVNNKSDLILFMGRVEEL